MSDDEVGKTVVDRALAVHEELGPGLLGTVYEAVLAYEFRGARLTVERQVPVPLDYRGLRFEEGFRIDPMVEGRVVIKVKSVDQIYNAHRKQLLPYLRLTRTRLSYLINFGEGLMKKGVVRIANGAFERT